MAKEKQNKDELEHLHLHQVKLSYQKEFKAAEHEHEREVFKKLDELGAHQILYQPGVNESRNVAQDEQQEQMQTVFAIDECDRSNVDLGSSTRDEFISQDIRKHYYRIQIQNKYREDLKQQAEERHMQRQRQINKSLNQTPQKNRSTYESCVNKAGRKQKEKEFIRDLYTHKSVDKCKKTEEVKERKAAVPTTSKSIRKPRVPTFAVKKQSKVSANEQHQNSVDEKRIKKCIEKKDVSAINRTTIYEKRTKEEVVCKKEMKGQKHRITVKSPDEKVQHKKRVEKLFVKQEPVKSKVIVKTTIMKQKECDAE